MAFITFTKLCKPLYLVPRHIHHPKETPYLLTIIPSTPPAAPGNQQLTIFFSIKRKEVLITPYNVDEP